MAEFSFNEPDHSYWLGARRLYGTTEVIKRVGLMGSGDFYTDLGRDRGKAVHAACELLFWDNLDWSSVDERIFGYVVSCHEFIKQTKFKARRAEFQFYHPLLCYAGQWDVDGDCSQVKDIMLDLKSGAPEKWHRIQSSAYREGADANKIKIKRRGSLYLQADGSVGKIKIHDDRNDWKAFYSALLICQKEDQLQRDLEPYRENLRLWQNAT